MPQLKYMKISALVWKIIHLFGGGVVKEKESRYFKKQNLSQEFKSLNVHESKQSF
jgi:hypothetical protein